MTLNYKNSTIYYTINGSGQCIILLHGFLETTAMWKSIEVDLSKKYQVICIDLLGHGETDCIGYVHSMEDMAEAVNAVLEYSNISKATFIGHSMGGYVALALAETNPQLFEGLCLMNSTFEADNDERKALRKRANKMIQTNFKNMVRMSVANLFAPESKLKFETELNEALNVALKTPIQGYIAGQEGMRIRPDRFDVYRNLNCNKLIIIGAKDSVIDGQGLIAKIEGTSIKFIQLSEGHMSHIENKEDLSYIIKHFIEK